MLFGPALFVHFHRTLFDFLKPIVLNEKRDSASYNSVFSILAHQYSSCQLKKTMDTDRIQINIDTPVEVEFHFPIKDVSGKSHQAMIRYQYPLFVKDYFSRAESILANKVFEGIKIRLTKDTLYSSRKRWIIQKNTSGLRFVGNVLVSINPSICDLSFEVIQTLSKDNQLKCYVLQLPLYVRFEGTRDELIFNNLSFDYPLTDEWHDIVSELSSLSKLINGQLSRNDWEKLWSEINQSYYVVDSIILAEDYSIPNNIQDNLILEYKTYKEIPGTTKTYRIDPANTNTQTQKHIHVYFDGKQLYAMNVDGTPHDGSKYRLSKSDMRFLASLGFKVPENGILDAYLIKDNKQNPPS